MTKTVTLHIGATKTGSTSIQSCLAQNRALLAQNGVLYPKTLGRVNHNVIPVCLHGEYANNLHQSKYGIKTQEDYTAFTQARPTLLADEIAQHDPTHVIISSEHMHSRCYRDAHFTRLKALLSPALIGRDIRIVAYLRPQISHAVSLYSTMLRHGAVDKIDDFIAARMSGRNHAYFDFHKMLKKWTAAFPSATLVVRPFSHVKALPHGVLSDFLAIENLSHVSDKMTFEPRQNQSMGPWTAEVLRLLNEIGPQSHMPARKWLRFNVPAGHIIPDADIARSFQTSFEEGNAWVAKTYLGGDSSAFDVTWSKFAQQKTASQDGLSPAQFVAFLREMTAP